MTDQEFDLLDALYFVTGFEELRTELDWEEIVLKDRLIQLIGKGWVKCLKSRSDEEVEDMKDIEIHYKKYHYLATKAGLFAHNSR